MRSRSQPHQRDQDLRFTRANVLRDRASYHGDFVTSVEIRAVQAILVDLVRQFFARGHRKSHVAEELRDAREQANAGHAMVFRFVQQRLYQLASGAAAFGSRHYGDGANLGKVQAIKMQSTTTDNLTFIFRHHEVAHVFA